MSNHKKDKKYNKMNTNNVFNQSYESNGIIKFGNITKKMDL